MKTAGSNIALIRRAFNLLESGDVEGVEALTGPDYPIDVERCKELTRSVFPDCRITIEDVIASDDKVVTRYTVRGTHQGAGTLPGFGLVKPTGKSVAMEGVVIHRVAGGKIVEGWGSMDMLETMLELGIISPQSGDPSET